MIIIDVMILKEVFEKLEQLEFKKSDVIGEALCALIGDSHIVNLRIFHFHFCFYNIFNLQNIKFLKSTKYMFFSTIYKHVSSQ